MKISDDYAKNAYIYAYPMDECYKYLYNTTIKENIPLNEFQARPKLEDYTYTEHPTINNDTVHVMGWLDVAAEPQIVTVPDVPNGRYWVLQTMDLGHYTDSLFGARNRGEKGGSFMYAAYDWKGDKPEGVDEIVRVRTNIIKIMGRIMSTGTPDDLKIVQALQDQWKLEPLSKFKGEASSPAPKKREYPDPEKTNWLERVNYFLGDGSAYIADEKWLNDFKDIGLAPNKMDFTDEQLDAAKRGEKLGMARIKEYAMEVTNGNNLLGTRNELQDGNRLDFSEGVYIGQWGAPTREAVYYQRRHDADGNELDGSTGKKYQIILDEPNVSEFWSYTMYKTSNELMAANPMNRYSRNDKVLRPRADGKYVIQMAYDCTGQEDNDNFLPAPNEPFYILLRLYGADKEILSGNYDNPVVHVVEAFDVPYERQAETAK